MRHLVQRAAGPLLACSAIVPGEHGDPSCLSTLACWALLEVGLRVREAVRGKGGRTRDRGTRVLIASSLGSAIGVASVAISVAPSLRVPVAVQVFGVIVMWSGLATRVWAVVALGGAFRITVEVDPDQAVVTSGPYKWIRHPSYAGLLLILAGSASRLATGCRRPHVSCSRCPR